MKKYITKDDFERFLIWHNISLDKIPLPTVTKADMCREFAYKLRSRIVYNIGSGKAFTYADAIDNAIDSLLAEMENEK